MLRSASRSKNFNPGAWLNRFLSTLTSKLRPRTKTHPLLLPDDFCPDFFNAIRRNVTITLPLGPSSEEHPRRNPQAAFAHAGLSVLSHALLYARNLTEFESDLDRVQVRELMDAVHNVPHAIADPDSYFGIHGDGHDDLRRGFERYDADWGGYAFGTSLTPALTPTYDAARASPVGSRRILRGFQTAHADRAPRLDPLFVPECSVLLPGCRPLPHPGIARWAVAANARAKALLTGSHVRAHLRAFRWSSRDILELSLNDELGGSHAITFTAGCSHTFHVEEPAVPDLVEALHMAGIVVRTLNAVVTVGDRDAFERSSRAS